MGGDNDTFREELWAGKQKTSAAICLRHHKTALVPWNGITNTILITHPMGHIPVVLPKSHVSDSSTYTGSRAQWLRGRALDSRLRGPGFESYATVLKPWASFFTLHCSSSLSCIIYILAINSGGYVYKQHSRINCSIWLDASQRS